MVGNRHCEETKATKQSRGYGSPRRYASRDDGEGLSSRDDEIDFIESMIRPME